MSAYVVYATAEEIAELYAKAYPLGKAWIAEVNQAMRGDRMFRTRYHRLRALLEKATTALKTTRGHHG